MPNTLRPEQDRIVQIHIRRRAIAKGLSGVEDERNMHADFLLTLDEPLQGVDVVDQGLQGVLVSNQVKPYTINRMSETLRNTTGRLSVVPQIK